MSNPEDSSSERLAFLFLLEAGSSSSQELLSSLSEARYTVFDDERSECVLDGALARADDLLAYVFEAPVASMDAEPPSSPAKPSLTPAEPAALSEKPADFPRLPPRTVLPVVCKPSTVFKTLLISFVNLTSAVEKEGDGFDDAAKYFTAPLLSGALGDPLLLYLCSGVVDGKTVITVSTLVSSSSEISVVSLFVLSLQLMNIKADAITAVKKILFFMIYSFFLLN
ncbi:hypothetical protein [Fibrobacter sp. UWB16]|uniref:hypothetical protein n=1 Tax=Fibrobacter sp. UWB16 TaxID=1945874 RepID=UPI001F1E715D|nr:hypothetical protein [Fibrobacter sp. UWB16]